MIDLLPYTDDEKGITRWLSTVVCDACGRSSSTHTTTPYAIEAAKNLGYVVSDLDDYEAYCRRCKRNHSLRPVF